MGNGDKRQHIELIGMADRIARYGCKAREGIDKGHLRFSSLDYMVQFQKLGILLDQERDNGSKNSAICN